MQKSAPVKSFEEVLETSCLSAAMDLLEHPFRHRNLARIERRRSYENIRRVTDGSLASGTSLGPYEIQASLGEGGMGQVYRARDVRLDRDVALKILAPRLSADLQFRERFEREARAIASLNHPHICAIYDIGSASDGNGEIHYLVMEYLDGETLAARLRRGRPAFQELRSWAIQTADALETAHARGLVHRDIKPANLFITTAGAVKVLDFGVAKLLDQADDAKTVSATDVGTAIGTVAYMSPEQARGEHVDARSDVFSLGAVLYEAATGQMAFGGPTAAVIFDRILNRDVRLLRDLSSDTPPDFGSIVERMLAKQPRDRYARVGDVAVALRTLDDARAVRSRSAPGTEPLPSIAVLPFADMSPLRDQDWFCEGIADELIGALARLPGLRVVSRTSSFRFKNAQDVRKVGEELAVESILEGSVRRAGNRVRVTAQLTRVADGYQTWSERYDRELEDVFEIQDDIARAIVGALKVTLLGEHGPGIVKRQTHNLEAYQICLKGRQAWHLTNFPQAAALFAQALALDPSYALPHFGLGDCVISGWIGGFGDSTSPAQARALLERAVALDPEFAEAHAILGVVQGMGFWEWREAERSFATALRLNYRSAHVLMSWSGVLMQLGRPAEAVAMARTGIELDPLVPTWHWHLALVHYFNAEYVEAVERARTALALDPANYLAHTFEGLALAELGEWHAAVTSLETAVQSSGEATLALGFLGAALAHVGRRDEAEHVLKALVDRPARTSGRSVSVATLHFGLGDPDQGFAWLERAVGEHDPQLTFALRGPHLRASGDPRVEVIRRRVFGR
jgi:serine/threonine-protein kinase